MKEIKITYTSFYFPSEYGGGYGGYEGGYGYPQHPEFNFMSSAISPDLKYLVVANNGIHLVNLTTGKSKLIN